ncbi:MAG TPA: metal-dependent hydrolase [Candidatus Methylomirabilis sp.]|nr:metal-dependent hydrolase [Candidatus Methylomirabilis sp.]
MDIVTHGLASLAIARGFFPRAGKAGTVAAVAAGVLADGDWISVYFGPTAFLTWHRTCFHSLLSAIFFAAVLTIVLRPILKEMKEAQGTRLSAIFAASLCAALVHVAMDACQSSGVVLLWPFSSRRFALDWLPGLDPWILAILIACIAVPELLRLVSSEIGAKEKRPRGQTGAWIGLALLALYVGVRGTLHSNVVAALESRTFHGEAARRARAFPESLSLITWHSVVETESALDEIEVNAAATSTLDADLGVQLFKPQSSPTLDKAQKTGVARRFLAIAQIPKASVEKTEAGYLVVVRDLRYAASGETTHEIAALIELDFNNNVTSEELVWARDLPH